MTNVTIIVGDGRCKFVSLARLELSHRSHSGSSGSSSTDHHVAGHSSNSYDSCQEDNLYSEKSLLHLSRDHLGIAHE